MTTPRVTEIPLALASVEPDPFVETSPRAMAVQRRPGEREPQLARASLVRRVMQLRAARMQAMSGSSPPA